MVNVWPLFGICDIDSVRYGDIFAMNVQTSCVWMSQSCEHCRVNQVWVCYELVCVTGEYKYECATELVCVTGEYKYESAMS